MKRLVVGLVLLLELLVMPTAHATERTPAEFRMHTDFMRGRKCIDTGRHYLTCIKPIDRG